MGFINFDGKVALVTGASSGIGRATAIAFGAAGARVAVAARNETRGQQTGDAIRNAGGIAELIVADLEVATDIENMVSQTVRTFGRLDYAFNNGGMVGDMAPLGDQDTANWDRVIRTDLTATFHCMKHEIRAMLENGGGVIVNNASGAGVMPQPTLSPYAAAKHGILGLTKTAAREYARHNIRINAVCPGLIATPQLLSTFEEEPEALSAMVDTLPMQQMGSPDDIANAVLWLCSDHSRYVSGESLFVDGALACR